MDLDSPLRATRFALHICVCADGSATSRGAFDAALRFCKAGDKLTVLHIASISQRSDDRIDGEEQMVRRYWMDECEKVSFAQDGLSVGFAPVTLSRSQTIVNCILVFLEANKCQLCVMGSKQLIKEGHDEVLGSVAQAVANQSRAHCCIIKSYGQE